MRLLPAIAAALLLSGCGTDTLGGGREECPPNAACAPPRQAAAPTPDDPRSTVAASATQPGDPATTPFTPAAPPDGTTTVPLPTAYLGPDPQPNRIKIRVEYPDLCQTLLGLHTAETPDAVTITAVGTPASPGACPLRLRIATGYIDLEQPLGDRTVTTQP